MAEARSKVSPVVATAAVAVIIFSVVGVGVMTGVIPSSRSTETATQAADAKAAQAPKTRPSQAAPRPSNPSPPAKQPAAQVAVAEPIPAPVAAAPQVCAECGVVDTINVVEQKGPGSGLGAAGGAVVGGLLGNQVGGGSGRTAATVAGAVGGALAGNEVEKRVKSTKQYNVAVRMEDGNFKTFTFDTTPAFSIGEKVKIIDGRLVKS